MNITWKYIKRCIANITNRDFKKWMITADRNPYIVEFRQLGEKQSDRNIYIIENDDKSHGFFAEYRMTLNYLAFADRYHFVPYIWYNKDYRYAEKNKILDTDNPFEYYFEQPSDLHYEDAYAGKNVVFAKNAHGDMVEAFNRKCCSYEITDTYIEEIAKIAKKYIRYNKATKTYLDTEYRKIKKKGRILGVHYRGSDFKENYDNHPVSIELRDFTENVKKIVNEKHFSHIFLATDDLEAVKVFKEMFSEMLLCYDDVCRTDGEVSVAFSEDEREYHHYKLGLEVLRDMYTLSECDGLVAGMSQVSNMARVMKRAAGAGYEYEVIIDLGINKNGKKFRV